MMQSLVAACEEGESAIKKLKASRSSLPLLYPQDPQPSSSTSYTALEEKTPEEKIDLRPTFDIFKKLEELCEEEEQEERDSECEEEDRCACYKSLILDKLVQKERLNTLILNLYPGNKGYSLAFRAVSRTDPNYVEDDTANMIETKQRPYEVEALLQYINNEELPPFLLDIIEQQFSYLFYSGCIIAEVRDYRKAYPHCMCYIHHVLLRPDQKSILADINNIIEDNPEFTNEDKDQLESQILMANTPDLCLDPDPTIESRMAEIHNRKYMWNTQKLHRMARKCSQRTVNRKRKLDQFTYMHGLELYEFTNRTRRKPRPGVTLRPLRKPHEEIKPIPVPNLDSPLLNRPTDGVVINEFKTYQRPKETSDCLPQLIEEYVLETDMPSKDRGQPRVYHIKLSIFQRPSNSEYLGELYLDRDHKKNEQNGVACRFSLGSRANANRYIHQFTEIFTESGRKSVRIRYGLSPGYKERVAIAQAQAQQIQTQSTNQDSNLAREHLNQLSQALQGQTCVAPLVNGTIASNVNLSNQNHSGQNAQNVPILQNQLQAANQKQQHITNQELEINALATKLMNSAQQFQAAANAKQQAQQQQQKIISGGSNNAAIINLLNSSPASNINSDASAAVVNAINSSSVPQQRLLARKMTLSNVANVANARVLNHSNLITLNNRMNLNELNAQLTQQQPQTITLTSVNSGNYTNYTTVPIKQQVVNQRILNTSAASESGKSALSALLVGTPAANRPDIVGPNTNSLLLEKLAGASSNSQSSSSSSHFIQSPKTPQQFVVQSPKGNTVMSPLSSPPPHNTNTINVQSLNFAQLQLQNVQVQLPGFVQPIALSLNVSSAGNIQGHPTSLLVSLPVTTATQTSNTMTQAGANSGSSNVNSVGVGAGQTVVLTNAGTSNLAHLVSSGVKGISQSSLRSTSAGPQTVSITQGGQQFQLISQLQRPRQQTNAQQSQLASRTIQRTPITIKMATPNSNSAASQVNLPPNASLQTHLKQAQLQQYQQLCLSQQKNMSEVLGRIRRSNMSEQQ